MVKGPKKSTPTGGKSGKRQKGLAFIKRRRRERKARKAYKALNHGIEMRSNGVISRKRRS